MPINMCVKVFVVLLAVSLIPLVLSRTRRISRNQFHSLSRARCDLTCFERSREGKEKMSQCRNQCRSQESKPGTCPMNDTPKWAAACIEACTSDSQCDGTQKCCHHGCGSSCNEPIDLETLPGLPAIPLIEEIKERSKGKVQIKWSDGVGDAARAVPGRVLYVLEEQHHLGPKFEEMRLGDWSILMRTNKTKVTLRDVLKSGRWYRFRVASVSTAGTRGFSKPSAPFTSRRGPRPPTKPKKLKVRPLKMENGTVTIRLEWKEPQSDLPVMRYKVFWSRRARGIGGELDSVLVNHKNVPKSQNFIDITDLQPNSMYFLQVQTISQFGLGKLRSEKAEIFYNTTNAVNGEFPKAENLQKRKESKIKNLKLHKIVWHNHKIKAIISWESAPEYDFRRFYIHWKTLQCQNPKKLYKDLTATTQETTFEIYELDYQCSYVINVNTSPKTSTPETELQLKVPGCQHFKRVNSTLVSCDIDV